nr:putative cdp-alcohol phosphatidyltransferase class-i family protein c22a12.08c [Quercus suber]
MTICVINSRNSCEPHWRTCLYSFLDPPFLVALTTSTAILPDDHSKTLNGTQGSDVIGSLGCSDRYWARGSYLQSLHTKESSKLRFVTSGQLHLYPMRLASPEVGLLQDLCTCFICYSRSSLSKCHRFDNIAVDLNVDLLLKPSLSFEIIVDQAIPITAAVVKRKLLVLGLPLHFCLPIEVLYIWLRASHATLQLEQLVIGTLLPHCYHWGLEFGLGEGSAALQIRNFGRPKVGEGKGLGKSAINCCRGRKAFIGVDVDFRWSDRFPSALTDRRVQRGLASVKEETSRRQESSVPSKAPENALLAVCGGAVIWCVLGLISEAISDTGDTKCPFYGNSARLFCLIGQPNANILRQAADNDHSKISSVAQSIDTARTTSKVISEKVRSSLTNLSPRENIYNLPNFLTVSRLIAAPVTAYLLLHDHHQWALGLFAYAGITDLVDGWLARRWKLQTVAGSVIDPMADKALMIILTVTLAIKASPVYLATLILGRDASLAIAAFYYRFASLPSPKTFMRYWDFSLPSAEVHPTTVSKYNTFLQLILIGSALTLPVLTTSPTGLAQLQSFGLDIPAVHVAMTYFQYVVAATTAWSGLSYAYLKNAVTILGADEALKTKQGARGRAIIGFTFGSVVLAALYIAVTVDEEQRKEEQQRAGADEATASLKSSHRKPS